MRISITVLSLSHNGIRSGDSVVDDTLDYQSRDRKTIPGFPSPSDQTLTEVRSPYDLVLGGKFNTHSLTHSYGYCICTETNALHVSVLAAPW